MLLTQIDFNKVKLPTTGSPAIDINSTALNIADIISPILPYVFTITGILLLLYLLLGGLQLMLSAGDPKKVQGAWAKITNAVIGFLIVFIAYWVIQLVGKILNIPSFGSIFGAPTNQNVIGPMENP